MFNQYYHKEHNLIYELWRDIVSFRKQFTELKGTTERDLTRVRTDLAQTGRSLTSACLGFLTAETQGQVNSSFRKQTSKVKSDIVRSRLSSNVNEMIESISNDNFERKHVILPIYKRSQSRWTWISHSYLVFEL